MNPSYEGNKGRISLFWQVDDPSSGLNLSTVKVEANGKPVVFKVTRDGLLYVDLSDPKNYFPDGRTVFTVTAVDWLGNTGTSKYVITFDSSVKPTKAPGSKPGDSSTGGTGRGDG